MRFIAEGRASRTTHEAHSKDAVMQEPSVLRRATNDRQAEPAVTALELTVTAKLSLKKIGILPVDEIRFAFGIFLKQDQKRRAAPDALAKINFADRTNPRRKMPGRVVGYELSEFSELLFAIIEDPFSEDLYRCEINPLTGKARIRGRVMR
jgi:hypothetical protein